jgi:hypothetical protein
LFQAICRGVFLQGHICYTLVVLAQCLYLFSSWLLKDLTEGMLNQLCQRRSLEPHLFRGALG